MTRSRARSRLVVRPALLAGVLTLCASGTALADVTGTVVNSAGVPVPGAGIELTEADGSFAGFDTTDANGAYSLATSGDTPPFTVTATLRDGCRDFSAPELSASTGGLPATATAPNLVLDPYFFCGTSPSSTDPPQTGNVWTERAQVLAPAGGVAYLRVLAPSGASGFSLSLADGTVVGSGTDRFKVGLTAPAAAYNGPLNLSYTADGAVTTRTVGTLTSGPIPKPAAPAGPTDLAAIVDISGSMSSADPSFRRKTAVQLLVDLANQGDRLVGTGFDDEFAEIFPRTTISGQSSKNRLKSAARRKIVNSGGTNYNIAFASAFTALSADPLNPQTPKAAIFLTDGANGGTYDNSHLRFAFNGTGQAWPICVVQLGRSFSATDTALLKRIARETGGAYSATPTNSQLESLYFQCRGRTAGATTLLKKTHTFRVGQSRTYSRKVKKNQRSATFFVSWGVGKYRIQIVQPGGKVFTRTTGTKVRFVSGKTSSFFQVRTPKAGLWRVKVTRLKTGARTDQATTTVSVQRKR
jgi:hypothetical protein